MTELKIRNGLITDIQANKEHKISEVICVNCHKRWIAVRTIETTLKQLKCPKCGMQEMVIETGEDLK